MCSTNCVCTVSLNHSSPHERRTLNALVSRTAFLAAGPALFPPRSAYCRTILQTAAQKKVATSALSTTIQLPSKHLGKRRAVFKRRTPSLVPKGATHLRAALVCSSIKAHSLHLERWAAFFLFYPAFTLCIARYLPHHIPLANLHSFASHADPLLRTGACTSSRREDCSIARTLLAHCPTLYAARRMLYSDTRLLGQCAAQVPVFSLVQSQVECWCMECCAWNRVYRPTAHIENNSEQYSVPFFG